MALEQRILKILLIDILSRDLNGHYKRRNTLVTTIQLLFLQQCSQAELSGNLDTRITIVYKLAS